VRSGCVVWYSQYWHVCICFPSEILSVRCSCSVCVWCAWWCVMCAWCVCGVVLAVLAFIYSLFFRSSVCVVCVAWAWGVCVLHMWCMCCVFVVSLVSCGVNNKYTTHTPQTGHHCKYKQQIHNTHTTQVSWCVVLAVMAYTYIPKNVREDFSLYVCGKLFFLEIHIKRFFYHIHIRRSLHELSLGYT